MRHAIVQKATTVQVQPRLPSERDFRLNALVDEQRNIIDRLVRQEGEHTEISTRLPLAKEGPEKQSLIQGLAESSAEIASLKASLNNTQQKIAELHGDAGKPVQVSEAGSLLDPNPERMFGLTRGEFNGGIAFILLFPLMIAAVRILWKRGNTPASRSTTLDDARFTRLEQAVESVAIEVERVGEAQRYAAKLLAERQAEEAKVRS